MRANKQK